MTWSFSLVAYDQIVNNAAQVRYMSGGQFAVPIVFRGSSGGGLQVGATHSHTPENWYANVPALTVITPAFPRRCEGPAQERHSKQQPGLLHREREALRLQGRGA